MSIDRETGYDDDNYDGECDDVCAMCDTAIISDCEYWPYCSARCAMQAEEDSLEDMYRERQKGDDDGVEYADPRDAMEDKLYD